MGTFWFHKIIALGQLISVQIGFPTSSLREGAQSCLLHLRDVIDRAVAPSSLRDINGRLERHGVSANRKGLDMNGPDLANKLARS
jgi:hypothetical protein